MKMKRQPLTYCIWIALYGVVWAKQRAMSFH